ncbi:MAG: histidinol-phosphate aminotransferase family protein [Planctomycetes bacterium]|nr:histidinol-phosphate aminotransferase family protein [Planctomycetota bacterium]
MGGIAAANAARCEANASHGGGDRRRRVTLAIASAAERERIAELRHSIYAGELGQHPVNGSGRLADALDASNHYLVAKVGVDLAGFVSITPPAAASFSIDKYFPRAAIPFAIDEATFEVRLLSVAAPHRGTDLAALLMYAALRWVEAHGGRTVVGMGRREVLDLYLRTGWRAAPLSVQSGLVNYRLMHAEVGALREASDARPELLARLEARTDWELPLSFRKPAACFHGGAFFEAIGERFDDLRRRDDIINADVLDAWFPPAPGVISALADELPWLLRTSPPTDCKGLLEAIAEARGVPAGALLAGAGSSDLIFRALRSWLGPRSRALILDPTYGEYAHVLERVIGCAVDRFPLAPEEHFAVDVARLERALAAGYDLCVLVNPNSPTGRHVPRERLEAVLRAAPARTRIWVDETYVEYAGVDQSLERFAARSDNVVVCKSMSKVYALSGARVAYLCAGAHLLEGLRAITPPWVVGLPSQVAAVRALEDPAYYAAQHRATARLRAGLEVRLRGIGLEVFPGIANFLLCRLPGDGPTADWMVQGARERGLFFRDAARMGASLGPRFIRVAVKDEATNGRMAAILAELLASSKAARRA